MKNVGLGGKKGPMLKNTVKVDVRKGEGMLPEKVTFWIIGRGGGKKCVTGKEGGPRKNGHAKNKRDVLKLRYHS